MELHGDTAFYVFDAMKRHLECCDRIALAVQPAVELPNGGGPDQVTLLAPMARVGRRTEPETVYILDLKDSNSRAEDMLQVGCIHGCHVPQRPVLTCQCFVHRFALSTPPTEASNLIQ